MESTISERPDRSLYRRLAPTAIALFSLTLAGAAAADGPGVDLRKGVVFVMTNDASGNQVLAYDRARDGRLSLQGTYDTGGADEPNPALLAGAGRAERGRAAAPRGQRGKQRDLGLRRSP